MPPDFSGSLLTLRAAGPAVSENGSSTENLAPPCFALSTRTEPPCSSAIFCTIASPRPLPEVLVVAPYQLNTYDVLVNDRVVFTRAAFDVFVAGPASGKGAKAVASESEVGA